VSKFRRKPPPQQRTPHPDGRKEAELQAVLALFAAARRYADRLETVTWTQAAIDKDRRGAVVMEVPLRVQAAELRAERADLEDRIAAAHEEITRRLEKLGDDACYLGEIPS
jgi:hypothetical protein